MEIQSKTFQEKLDNIEKEFYLLMQQYNKYYVLSNTSKDRNNRKFFLNTQSNIESLFNRYSNLENSLNKSIKDIKKKFSDDDKLIKELKEKLEQVKKININLKQTSGASQNFKNQVNTYRKDNKIVMLYHFAGVLGISYLIYSSIRN